MILQMQVKYLKSYRMPMTVFTLLAKLSDFINRDTCNKENINVLLNRKLERNCVWLKINRLSLNTSKFKFMFFYQRQKTVAIPNIKINNTDLQCIDNFNFGGLTLNKHLGSCQQTFK